MDIQSLGEHCEEFAEHGFTVIRALVPREQTTGWRALRFFTERRDFDILGRAPERLVDTSCRGRHVDLVEYLLEGPAVLEDVLLKEFPSIDAAADGSPWINWHRDKWSHFPTGQDYPRPNSVSVLVYLQDLTDDVGPIRVIPGSHRRHIEVPADQVSRPHPDERLLRLEAGDGLVIHNCLLHAGSPNRSGRPRMFIAFGYNDMSVPEAMSHHGWGESIVAAARERGEPRTARLLGGDPWAKLVRQYRRNAATTFWTPRGAPGNKAARIAEVEQLLCFDSEFRALAATRWRETPQTFALDLGLDRTQLDAVMTGTAPSSGRNARATRMAMARARLPRFCALFDEWGESSALVLDAFDRAHPTSDRAPSREADRFVWFATTCCLSRPLPPALLDLLLEEVPAATGAPR
jgi:hypothetical protein